MSRPALRYCCSLIPILLFGPGAVTAQTNQTDSIAHARQMADSAAIRSYIKPIPFLGSLDPALSATAVIPDTTFGSTDYRHPGDFLRSIAGIFTPDLGSPGQFPSITMNGIGPRGIGILSDGISLNDPGTGLYNLYWYPAEILDRIEVISPSRSFLYGASEPSGGVNFVTKSHKAIHAYSRLRYSESANGFALVDGLVSQDILRGFNVTAGAEHFTYGPQYTNDSYDAWTGRLKLRYNISTRLNLFITEHYTQNQLGLNGGINQAETDEALRFDPRQAIVLHSDAYEKNTRHDLQIGLACRPLHDTTLTGTLTWYISSGLREFRGGTSMPRILAMQDQWTQWSGMRFVQQAGIGAQTAEFGADVQAQRHRISTAGYEERATRLSAFGSTRIAMGEIVTADPGVRIDEYRSHSTVSFGGEVTVHPTPCVGLFGGFSRSSRFPTFQETDGVSSLIATSIGDDSPEHHRYLDAGFRWQYGPRFRIEARAFTHTLTDAIVISPPRSGDTVYKAVYTRSNEFTVSGASASASLRLGSLFMEGTAQLNSNAGENGSQIPRWTGNGGIYYWDTLVHGHLRLKAGLHGSFFSGITGMTYSQAAFEYLPSDPSTNIQPTGTIDLVIIAHLGDAYIHFIWDNLLDASYIMTTYYPMPGRQLRFGVTWEFEN